MDSSDNDMWERPLRWSALSPGGRIGLLLGGAVIMMLVGGMLVELVMTGG